MKKPPRSTLLPCWFLVLLMVFGSGFAAAVDCDGRYLTTDRNGQQRQSRHPSDKFSETLKKAKDGVSLEQRNLAVSYGSGYQISRCFEKSVYWYKKAAESGDEIAQQWLINNKSILSLLAGKECAGDYCFGSSSDETSMAVLYSSSDKNNHFFAPVTINGRTVQGMIDTGASTIAMSPEMAKTFGINTDGGQSGQSSTANGIISTTRIIVPLIDVAGIKLRNVPVSVGITGSMLIGMSFLSRVNVSMGSGTLTMTKR